MQKSSIPKIKREVPKQLYLSEDEFNLINEACNIKGIPVSVFFRSIGINEARKILKEENQE